MVEILQALLEHSLGISSAKLARRPGDNILAGSAEDAFQNAAT
jgi:hypothetical protein